MDRNIKLSLGFSWLLCLQSAFAQKQDSGFFLVIENQANCAHLVQDVMDVVYYCIPNAPVIPKTEFEFIGDLKTSNDNLNQYLDLQLTPKGFETLKTLAARLPNTRLALVIENHVVGIFQGLASIDTPIIPIHGRTNSPEMKWLYQKVQQSRH